jgi:uncharacterized membrane protein YbhN (UPF0104 family)
LGIAKETVVKKRLLGYGLKYGLGFAVLAFVIWRNWSPPGGGIADALAKPVQFVPLTLACIIYSIGLLITFWRWYILVHAQSLPFTLLNALRLGLLGFFYSNFLPGSIGGDIVKAAFIAREQSRRTVAVATVLIDRALGLCSLIWLVALLGTIFWLCGNEAVLTQGILQTIILSMVAIVGLTLGLWLLLGVLPAWRVERFAGRLGRIPKIGHAAAEFWRAVWMYRCRGRSMALAMGLSLVSHACFVLAFYFAAQMFREPDQPLQIPTLAEHYLLIPIGLAVQALFILAPGGMGVGEAGFGALYQLVGQPVPAGVLASLAFRVTTLGLSTLGYLVFLQMRTDLQPSSSSPEDKVSELAVAEV